MADNLSFHHERLLFAKDKDGALHSRSPSSSSPSGMLPVHHAEKAGRPALAELLMKRAKEMRAMPAFLVHSSLFLPPPPLSLGPLSPSRPG